MCEHTPVTQKTSGACPDQGSPRKRKELRMLGVLLLGLMVLAGTAFGAPGPGAKPAATEAKAAQVAPAADFVGSETCATCHEDAVKNFAGNPHTKLALKHGENGATCEGCHGPGRAHVEGGGDKTKIFNFKTATTKQATEKCLTCHAGKHANFEQSAHGEGNVGCLGCHSVHAPKASEHLLKLEPTKLCMSCHTDVKAQFGQPFHHKVEEGLVKCSDCHDPHGTFQAKLLRTTPDQNAVCVKCHTEKAGPFVYEHPAVKIEGCSSCHTPHGSPNPRLLTVSNMNTLCLQCHSATNPNAFPNASSPVGPIHNQAAQYVACTTCHSQIHGSNASAFLLK